MRLGFPSRVIAILVEFDPVVRHVLTTRIALFRAEIQPIFVKRTRTLKK